MSDYVEDIRAFKRMKSESKADWLVWRKGRFSPNEIESIRSGLESWVGEVCEKKNISREEALESLKWARENKMKAWCDIATRCSLPERKIGAIRHCALRRMLGGSEVDRWTKDQTAEFVRLQEVYGLRAWKHIAKDTGRTLEDVANKGRQMEEASRRPGTRITRFGKAEILRMKLAQLIKQGEDENPYEYSAIRSDCKLVALVRRHVCPDGQLVNIHGLPVTKVCQALDSTAFQVRVRWHHAVLPEIVKRASIKLQDTDDMNQFLLLQTRKACKGTLTDADGREVYPSYDWHGLPWSHLMPLWPQTLSEARLRVILRRDAKFGISSLPEVVRDAYKFIIADRKKQDIISAAERHFEEIRRLFNMIADRGDRFLLEEGSEQSQ